MKSVEWLAGLLEGEGCFVSQKSGTSGLYRTPLVTLVMTDYDVVEKAAALFEVLGGRKVTVRQRALYSGKIAYDARTTGLPAVQIMLAVLPHMGDRRATQIRSLVAAWNPKKYRQAVEFKTAYERG